MSGAGKALDDQAAAMGAFADPARQPWRGVGNLNITRFDRTSAIEAVHKWSSALDKLPQGVRVLRAATQWEGIESIEAAGRACELVRLLPPLGTEIDCALLSLTPEPVCSDALSQWTELMTSALQFEASTDKICQRDKLSSELGGIRELVKRVEKLGAKNVTLAELEALHAKSQARARELAGAVGLMRRVLSVTERVDEGDLDLRAEALAASFLRNVQTFPYDKAYLRTARLAEDGVLEEIRVAHQFAVGASNAASEADFGETPTAAFAASLPSPREMRAAAAVIKRTSLVGKLFSREWRRAKATWRQVFPAEKVSASSGARLASAAKWKEGLESLEACLNAKDAIARNWRGIGDALRRYHRSSRMDARRSESDPAPGRRRARLAAAALRRRVRGCPRLGRGGEKRRGDRPDRDIRSMLRETKLGQPRGSP